MFKNKISTSIFLISFLITLGILTVFSDKLILFPHFVSFIKSIKGSYFLIYYAIYSIVLTIGTMFMLEGMNSSNKRIDLPYELSPISTIVLRIVNTEKSMREILNYTLFKFWRRNYIEMDKESSAVKFVRSEKELETTNLTEIEKYILDSLEKEKTIKQLYSYSKLKNLLATEVEKTKKELKSLGLFKTHETILNQLILMLIMCIIIFSVGFLKLDLGIQNNKPILYLSMELFFGLPMYLLLCLMPIIEIKQTQEAKDFLETLKNKYNKYKSDDAFSSNLSSNSTEVDMLYCLLGVSLLSDYPETSYFAKTLIPPINSSSSGGGSSCGGSSCGGSSCGGGGCGGCGGS